MVLASSNNEWYLEVRGLIASRGKNGRWERRTAMASGAKVILHDEVRRSVSNKEHHHSLVIEKDNTKPSILNVCLMKYLLEEKMTALPDTSPRKLRRQTHSQKLRNSLFSNLVRRSCITVYKNNTSAVIPCQRVPAQNEGILAPV